MPIYEYECDACHEVFEELILGKNDRPDGCPSCGGEQVHRVISQTSFQLKGDGWYVTDFKGSPAPAAPEATSKEAASDDTASTGSGSKPDSSGSTADASPAPSTKKTSSSDSGSTGGKGAA